MKATQPVHIWAALTPKTGEQPGARRGHAQPSSLGHARPLAFSGTCVLPPGGPSSLSSAGAAGAGRERQRLHYGWGVRGGAGGSNSCPPFLSGNLQGHFRVKRHLGLQQVPKFCPQPGWTLSETLHGQDLTQFLYLKEKKRCTERQHLPGSQARSSPAKSRGTASSGGPPAPPVPRGEGHLDIEKDALLSSSPQPW